MGKLEKYSSYKDSGVEWLGEIPEHWEVKKIKHIGKIKSGDAIVNNELKDSGKYEVFGGNGLMGYCNRYNVTNENFIIGRVGAYCGNVRFNNQKRWISDNALIFSLFKDESYNYVFHLLTASRLNSLNSSNAQPLITGNKVINFNIPYPPKEEQTKIASFLDEKTAQIDEVISQKQKLIELLKERKQIVINDAVTKGLDKDVEFVDSGIEWIGKIPKGWEVKKLKFIIKNKLKYGANESGISYDEALPRYVRITDFSDTGKLSEKNKLSLSWDKGKDYLLKDGDVLFARSGATVGKTYQFKKSMSIEKNYAFAGYLIKAEANETMILSDYLYLYTNSNLFNRWKESIFNKATIENIGADKYSELFFTLPSIEEQKLILKNYFIKSTKIDKAIELQQNYISKLKEYKASLIDSVVTGKVRV